MKKNPGSTIIDPDGIATSVDPDGYEGGSIVDPWDGPLNGFIDPDGAK